MVLNNASKIANIGGRPTPNLNTIDEISYIIDSASPEEKTYTAVLWSNTNIWINMDKRITEGIYSSVCINNNVYHFAANCSITYGDLFKIFNEKCIDIITTQSIFEFWEEVNFRRDLHQVSTAHIMKIS